MNSFQREPVRSCLVLVALVAFRLSAVGAQSLPESLAKLESPDSSVRMAAFYELLQPAPGLDVAAREDTLRLLSEHPGDREAIATALVKLLSRENSLGNEAAPGSLSESFGEYRATLIWSVATLRDARAIDALLGAIRTGGLAADGLVALGAAAMPAVLSATDSPNPQVRMGATMVLGKMASQRDPLGLSAADTEVIRARLLRAVEDGYYSVRWAAVLSLESFVDASVREALQRAATVDASEGVRQAANEWLAKHRSQ